MFGASVIIIILGVIFVVLAIAGIYDWRRNRKMYESLDDPIEEIPAVSIGALVVTKRANIQNLGGAKYPRSTLFCYATFSTDAGELVEYEIPQEFYELIKENDYGTLITVDGKFYAFDKG